MMVVSKRVNNTATAIVCASFVLFVATPVSAQDMREALDLYESKRYPEAALALHNVMTTGSPRERYQAQIYLAESLRRMELFASALFYYKEILRQGRKSRYYLNAVEGLLKLQRSMHDPVLVASLVSRYFDQEGFGQLDPNDIAHINYLVGEQSFRQGKSEEAKAFLSSVPSGSPFYPRAKYLLGLLSVKAGQSVEALAIFEALIGAIDKNTPHEQLIDLRNLATVAAARVSYGLGRFHEATKFYKQVPRFSDRWFYAMYENSWSYFQQGAYGKALGEISSVLSPYFTKRYVPETFVLQGTTYFTHCQWDRVRGAVQSFNALYKPMIAQLQEYLEAYGRQPQQVYLDVVKGGVGRFSEVIAREVRRTRRFRDFFFMLEHMQWELHDGLRTKIWHQSRLKEDLRSITGSQYDNLLAAVGGYARAHLASKLHELELFNTQMALLDFELTDAERQWLEQGREILRGRRARLPRPDIPNDQWQHWNFAGEYWKDELGYIQHSLACECLSQEECEVFQQR